MGIGLFCNNKTGTMEDIFVQDPHLNCSLFVGILGSAAELGFQLTSRLPSHIPRLYV